jgi:hypothetical protein
MLKLQAKTIQLSSIKLPHKKGVTIDHTIPYMLDQIISNHNHMKVP